MRRPRVPPPVENPEEGIRAGRTVTASAAALPPGADHSDGANRRLQPASFGGAATGALAAVEPGPTGLERAAHDAGTDSEHAGRAPRGCHGGGREAANVRSDSVQSRPHHGARPARPGTAGVRMLRSGQTRNGSFAPRQDCGLIADCAIDGVATATDLRALCVLTYIRSALLHATLALASGHEGNTRCESRAEHPSQTACLPPCRASSISACRRVSNRWRWVLAKSCTNRGSGSGTFTSPATRSCPCL